MKKWIALLLACALGLMPLTAMGTMAVDEEDETHYSLPVNDSPGLQCSPGIIDAVFPA